MGVNPKKGVDFTPQNGMVKIREKPMNKWMIWGVSPFLDLHPYR